MRLTWGRFVVLAVAAVALSAPAVRGQDSKRQQRAQWAKDERERAQTVRDEYAQFAVDAAPLDGFAKDDMLKVKEAYEAWARSFEAVAAAWDRNEEKQAWELQRQIGKAAQVAATWRSRVWEYRRRQAEAAPDERWYSDSVRGIPKGAMPEFDALVKAKRAAAEAWGRVAEATAPGADESLIIELREKAFAADAEREIAEWCSRWANDREWIWSDKKISSEELKRALAELQQSQDQRVALRRADVARDRRLREVERDMRNADARCRKAMDAAREAYYKSQR